MRMAKGWMRAGFAAALFALLLAPVLAGAGSALAQEPPANYYGSGLDEGVEVTAMIGEAECGSSTVGADGYWSIQISPGDCDGAAVEGATVSFMIGDAMAEQTRNWSSGFLPENIGTGFSLTPAPAPEPEPEDGMDGDDAMGDGDGDSMMENGDDAMDGGDGMMAPGAPDTGNAGLASSASGGAAASWLALGLGLMALAATAGARFATGRVR